MEELWRDVPGYDGQYQVSNMGRVRSNKHKKTIILKHIHSTTTGAVCVILFKNANPTNYMVHRLMWEAFYGWPADRERCFVLFKDGDRDNLTLDNLYCEVSDYTDAYDLNQSRRRGVKKPRETRDRMREAKYHQSRESIERGARTRSETCRVRKEVSERVSNCERELDELKNILRERLKSGR